MIIHSKYNIRVAKTYVPCTLKRASHASEPVPQSKELFFG